MSKILVLIVSLIASNLKSMYSESSALIKEIDLQQSSIQENGKKQNIYSSMDKLEAKITRLLPSNSKLEISKTTSTSNSSEYTNSTNNSTTKTNQTKYPNSSFDLYIQSILTSLNKTQTTDKNKNSNNSLNLTVQNSKNDPLKKSCLTSINCKPSQICNKNNNCEHKSALPPTFLELLCYIFLAFSSGISILCGIGGGAVFTATMMWLEDFSSAEAVPLSVSIMFISSLMTFYMHSKFKENNKQSDYVNFKLVLIFMPTILLGAKLGSIVNTVVPTVLLSLALLAFVLYSGWSNYKKYGTLIEEEKKSLSQTSNNINNGINMDDDKNKGRIISNRVDECKGNGLNEELVSKDETDISAKHYSDEKIKKTRNDVDFYDDIEAEAGKFGDDGDVNHFRTNSDANDLPSKKYNVSINYNYKDSYNFHNLQSAKHSIVNNSINNNNHKGKLIIKLINPQQNLKQIFSSSSRSNLTQAREELEEILEEENSPLPWKYIKFLLLTEAIILLDILVEGNEKIPSIVGVKKCSAFYWIIFILAIVVLYHLTLNFVNFLTKEFEYKRTLNSAYSEPVLENLLNNINQVMLIGLAVGIIAGAFGIGGGLVLVPLLLSWGFSPKTCSISINLLIVFSSFTSSVMYFLIGNLYLDYLFVIALPSLLSCYYCSNYVNDYIKKTGKQSILVLLLLITLVMAALFMIFSIGNKVSYNLANHVSSFQFHSFC